MFSSDIFIWTVVSTNCSQPFHDFFKCFSNPLQHSEARTYSASINQLVDPTHVPSSFWPSIYFLSLWFNKLWCLSCCPWVPQYNTWTFIDFEYQLCLMAPPDFKPQLLFRRFMLLVSSFEKPYLEMSWAHWEHLANRLKIKQHLEHTRDDMINGVRFGLGRILRKSEAPNESWKAKNNGRGWENIGGRGLKWYNLHSRVLSIEQRGEKKKAKDGGRWQRKAWCWLAIIECVGFSRHHKATKRAYLWYNELGSRAWLGLWEMERQKEKERECEREDSMSLSLSGVESSCLSASFSKESAGRFTPPLRNTFFTLTHIGK